MRFARVNTTLDFVQMLKACPLWQTLSGAPSSERWHQHQGPQASPSPLFIKSGLGNTASTTPEFTRLFTTQSSPKPVFIDVCGLSSRTLHSTEPSPLFIKSGLDNTTSRIREENPFQNIMHMLAQAEEHAGGRRFVPKTAITEQNQTLVVCQREKHVHKAPRVAFLFR